MPVPGKKVVAKGAPTTTSSPPTGGSSGGGKPKTTTKGKSSGGNPKAKKLARRPEDERRLARAIRFWGVKDTTPDAEIERRSAEVISILGFDASDDKQVEAVKERFTHNLCSKSGRLLAVQS